MTIDRDNMCALARRLRDHNRFDWNYPGGSRLFAAWKAETRDKLRAALDVDRIEPATAAIVSQWRDGDCRGQELELQFTSGEITRAYLLRPNTDIPTPTILLLHDHGSFFSIGKEKLVHSPLERPDLLADITHWVDRLYGGRFIGNELVRRGYTVLCADALGWGSRQGNGYEAQQALAANLLQFGISYASLILREDLEALAFLRGSAGVDAGRIATFGYSMGGSRAWQLAAISDDVAACVAGGWMGTLHGLMQAGNNQLRGQSAFAMLHPQIGGKLDYPHFAAMAAPKPTLIFTGAEDLHFPEPVAAEAYRQLHRLWDAACAAHRIETGTWPGAHCFTPEQQDHAFDWLGRHL